MKPLEFRWGLPYLLPTLLSILHRVSRVRGEGLERNVLGGAFLCMPLPRFVAS